MPLPSVPPTVVSAASASNWQPATPMSHTTQAKVNNAQTAPPVEPANQRLVGEAQEGPHVDFTSLAVESDALELIPPVEGGIGSYQVMPHSCLRTVAPLIVGTL